jgi:capsular polysaccharide transport system permease protein
MSEGMLSALTVQGRVIKALYLREMKTRFGEKRLGFLWAFGEPIMHVLAFVAVWKVFGRMGPPGIEPVLFLVTGIIPFIMFSNIVNRVMNSVTGNRALLVFPQVKVIDLVLSRIVIEITTFSVVFVFFIFACEYLGIYSPIQDPLGVFSKFILMALFGGGVGFLLMPLIAILPFLEQLVRFIIRATYLTSGVFFSIEKIPYNVRQYIDWNPVLQIMHMLRADYFPEIALKAELANVSYVIFLTVAIWLFAIKLTHKLMIRILED